MSRQKSLINKQYNLGIQKSSLARDTELGHLSALEVSEIRPSSNKSLPSSYYKLGSVLDPEKIVSKGWEKSMNKI